MIFFDAREEEDLDKVENFIKKGYDVNYLVDHGPDVSKKTWNKRTALHYASERGNLKVVEALLSKGAEIDVEDEDRCTPLKLAAGRGHIDILLCLIDHGADVDKEDGHKRTALHYASERRNLKVVEALLSKGAEIDVEDEDCCTPLKLAAGRGHIDILLCLIDHGADVDKKDGHKRTALHYASERGDLKVVEALLSKGAEIDVEDGFRYTPLILTAGKRHSDVSLYLIDHGANVNIIDGRKRTALHHASKSGDLEIVKALLSKGAEIDVEDDVHCTPLMLAAGKGHNDVSLYLIDRGADVYKTGGRDQTALHYASERGDLKVVEALLGKGAEIDVEDLYRCTPLMLAAGRGHIDILLYLIDHGADVNKKGASKRTALHYASEWGDLKVIEALLSKGAKIDVEDEDPCTPLMLAARKGHNGVSLYLIDHGVDVNKKDGRDQTALHYASERGDLNVVEALLSKGAEIDVEDKDCCTPLMLAAGRGHNDISLYLIDHGADVSKKNGCDQTALHYASERGDLKVVEALLSKGAEIDVEDEDHCTPLMFAAGRGHIDILLCLIDHGADVNKKDRHKRTALHHASERGDLKVVEALLSKGAEIDVDDWFHYTSIRLTARKRHRDVPLYLIDHGANVNKIEIESDVEDGEYCTPLKLAAKKGHIDILLCLIDHGADVNEKDRNKRTALHYASERGDLKVVEALLSKGAEIDVEDWDSRTPLKLAAERGHIDILLCLIDHGADVDKKDGHKRTALHYFSVEGNLKVVEALLSKGAEIEVEDEDHCTPLILAVECQWFAIMCHLIKAGANVKRLVDYFSSIGKGGYHERDPLLHALSYSIDNNHIAEAGVLITNGVGIEGELDINPPRTALTWSAENGHDSLVRNLILQGVNVNYQDDSGRSALHFAASFNHIQCGILLVEAGADLRLVDRDSHTPLDLASKELKDAINQTLSFNTKKTVCVIGNACSGKSTLIASLQNENAKLLEKVYHWLFGVKNINKRTAGIKPVSLSSKRYGDTVFLDFAGQHEYHGPHEMFLESISSKSRCTVTIIMVVKVTDEEPAISQQLDRWFHPVSKMATTMNPIRLIVIGSHMDKVKSKVEAKSKLEHCYQRVQQSLCEAPLKFHDACYLDCRQPYSSDIEKLCAYLNEVPIPQYKAAELSYSICWVISRMKTSLESEAIRVSDFTKWIEENKANLPTNLPPSEEVCKDLSSTGHFLYLPNKEDPSNGWLVLDLPFILHEVYGTLFSPSKKIVNKFGLLNCQKLSVLFPSLDEGMVRNVLTSLEFCIDVDLSILAEEVTQLTESTDKNHDHLFFPALVSSQPPKVFLHSQQGCHVLSWQLVVVRRPFISPRLLQTIILRLAAHRVFHSKQDSNTREHYCSVWCNGIFWQSTEDVDVAVQISDSTIVELIGRSEVSPEVLSSYISTIAGDISATIHELSPTLWATAYIIHPADPQVLLENHRSPSPHKKFPVDFILESMRNGRSTCVSCKVEEEPATRKPISDLFCGFVPKEDVIGHLSFVAGEFVCLVLCCVLCYLSILLQQLYFILQCTICSILSSICLCMYCTYVHVFHCIVLLHCSSVCNSCTYIVHCECVLL